MKHKENLAGSRMDLDHERCAYRERCLNSPIYNDHLVNIIGPKETASLSKHMAMKAGLHHAPLRFREEMGKSDMFPIIWDSGASVCVTFDESDFLSLDKSKSHKPMKSTSGRHAVKGEGYVLLLRHFKLKARWVPESQFRLLSTETLLQKYKGEFIEISSGELV